MSFVRKLKYIYIIFPGVILPPYNQTMFSYFVDIFSGNFVSWDSFIPSSSSLIDQGSLWNFNDEQAHFKSESGIDFVQTVDSVRYSFLSALLVLHKNPVLLTGIYFVFCAFI